MEKTQNDILLLNVKIVTLIRGEGIDQAIYHLIPERVVSVLAACDLQLAESCWNWCLGCQLSCSVNHMFPATLCQMFASLLVLLVVISIS